MRQHVLHCQLVLLTVSCFLAEKKIPVLLLRHFKRTTNTHKPVTTLTCHGLRSFRSHPLLTSAIGIYLEGTVSIGGRLWNGHCVMLTLLFFSPWYDSVPGGCSRVSMLLLRTESYLAA